MYGEVGIVWSKEKRGKQLVQRIFLPSKNRSVARIVKQKFPTALCRRGKGAAILHKKVQDLIQGKQITFASRFFDLSGFTPFERRVLKRTQRIRRGKVATYAGIAYGVGVPRAVRAVGNVLAKNHFPLFIPCHRVVCSNGTIGGFQRGTQLKRVLLENEGVLFDKKGRVKTQLLHK
ncbi:MAG: MGMT family protein [Candidatus Omnitrophica bacterium]|nr:MGMT family protein [Candidatus Omnitrophota bacterium]